MSDTGTCRPTPRKRLVSINLQGNPNMYAPPKRAELNPNILGFIDESPYTGPGINIRTNEILNWFHRLQRNINEWQSSIRNVPSSSVEIHQKFNLFTKDVANLSNQALLAAVSTMILRDISNLGDILARIKRFGLIDQAVL